MSSTLEDGYEVVWGVCDRCRDANARPDICHRCGDRVRGRHGAIPTLPGQHPICNKHFSGGKGRRRAGTRFRRSLKGKPGKQAEQATTDAEPSFDLLGSLSGG